MPEFSFKPAPVRKQQTWHLQGRSLTRDDEPPVSLSAVTEVIFGNDLVKGRWMSMLHLKSGDKTIAKMQCSDPSSGLQRPAMLALVDAVLAELERIQPNLVVRWSASAAIGAWGAAIIGVGLGLFGFSMIWEGVSDVNGRGLAFGFGAGALALGAFMIWAGQPWKGNPPLPISQMRERVVHIRANTARG